MKNLLGEVNECVWMSDLQAEQGLSFSPCLLLVPERTEFLIPLNFGCRDKIGDLEIKFFKSWEIPCFQLSVIHRSYPPISMI